MKTFKGYVSNKARPEGCIAERCIKEEAITYCTSYKGKGKAIFQQNVANGLDGLNELPSKVLDDDENGEDGAPIGIGHEFVMPSIDYEQARSWVIKSHPSYEMWRRYIF